MMTENPAFVPFAITAVVLGLQMVLLDAYSGVHRAKSRTTPNREDASTVAKGAELVPQDPDGVARVMRAHRNLLANATPFLHLVGHTIVASCWLEQALVAERGGDGFCKAKLAAAKYFFRWELPRTEAWAKVLTPIERTPLDLDPDWL